MDMDPFPPSSSLLFLSPPHSASHTNSLFTPRNPSHTLDYLPQSPSPLLPHTEPRRRLPNKLSTSSRAQCLPPPVRLLAPSSAPFPATSLLLPSPFPRSRHSLIPANPHAVTAKTVTTLLDNLILESQAQRSSAPNSHSSTTQTFVQDHSAHLTQPTSAKKTNTKKTRLLITPSPLVLPPAVTESVSPIGVNAPLLPLTTMSGAAAAYPTDTPANAEAGSGWAIATIDVKVNPDTPAAAEPDGSTDTITSFAHAITATPPPSPTSATVTVSIADALLITASAPPPAAEARRRSCPADNPLISRTRAVTPASVLES